MYRIVEGGVQVIATGEVIPMNPLSRDYRRYLHYIAVPLESRIAAKWEQIKAMRDHLSDTGGYKVIVEGVDKWFHSDTKSRTQQLGLVMAGVSLPPIAWKTMDGTFVTMTPLLAGAVFQAAMAQEAAIFQVAEQHRAAMEASEDPTSYDFSAGWPPVFQP